MPRRRVRAITVTACSVALLAAGTAGASPASARAQDHQRLAPRTHFVMAPDGSSGERAQGAAIPNIDSVKKTIRAYYGAGDAGTANPTTSPYISEMRSIVAQQGRYLDRAKQAAKRHHQRPAIVFDADDTTLWTYDMEDAAMHFNFDSALQNTWVQEQKFPATPSMVEFVNRAARMGFAIFGITGRTDTQEEATVANLAKVGYTPFNAENFYTKWSGTNPQPKYVTCAAKCTTVEYKAGTRRHIEKDLGYDIVLNVGDQWSDLQGGYADKVLKLPNPTYNLPSPDLDGTPADRAFSPRSRFTMQPDGSSGATEGGEGIPNIDIVKTTIRAYYKATSGIADKVDSPYIREMARITEAADPAAGQRLPHRGPEGPGPGRGARRGRHHVVDLRHGGRGHALQLRPRPPGQLGPEPEVPGHAVDGRADQAVDSAGCTLVGLRPGATTTRRRPRWATWPRSATPASPRRTTTRSGPGRPAAPNPATSPVPPRSARPSSTSRRHASTSPHRAPHRRQPRRPVQRPDRWLR